MYELYITNKNYSSWSLRAWVLMRELAIPFIERLVPMTDGAAPQPFGEFSPSGRVPCLIDAGTVVWDSIAITEYLAERHAGVWPQNAPARAFARCAAAEMHSGFGTLREICTMNCGLRVQLGATPAALGRDLARLGALWNDGLQRFGGPYLAGAAFSAVDAFFAPVVFRVQTYGLPTAVAGTAYCARLLGLPSMREWYRDALAESWREPLHEADARRAGIWLKDLRRAAADAAG